MNFESAKNETIKALEKKASYYLKNGDSISAQLCLAQIRVIAGRSQSDSTMVNIKTLEVNRK